MTDFLAMGGYGVYVWPAYGLAALVLAGLFGLSLRGLRRHQAELAALEAQGAGAAPHRAARQNREA